MRNLNYDKGRKMGVSKFIPCSGHVDSDLLQQTLPVTDIKIGPSSTNFCFNVQVQRLQLAVCLSFKNSLYISAHSCVDALTTIT